ncbi:hypothetical protein ACSLVQ_29200, partial [Klebsiella pneumoniae]|uniref:hypothetical protein n=1 Tax=Klebsiella pneumoniae TaxID=573 RepID=UPI003EDFC21C
AFVDETFINAICYVPGVPVYDSSTAQTIAATDDHLIAAHSSHPGLYNPDANVPDSVPLATIDKTLHQVRGTNAAPVNSDDVIWNT